MPDPAPSPDLDATAARRIFWSAALAFAALTTLLPPLCFPTFRSDVLEQIIIGREWVLGSAKHPALTTWIMQVFWVVLGGSSFAPSLAASVCATVTIWAVWRLGRDYLPEREALFGALCLTAYWYTSLGGSGMYNNNVTLIAFWQLAVLAFHVALKTGRAAAWIATGLCLGAALLCKYSAIILVASIGVFLLANADARRRLRTPGPWLAALATTSVFLPHAIFMVREFGGSYDYLEQKRLAVGILPFCLVMARDWLLQLLIAAPILLALAPLVDWPPRAARRGDTTDYAATFLPAMFGLPIVIQTLLQFATRVAYAQRSYGSHLWILLGLCTLFMLRTTADARRWRRAALVTAGLAAALLVSLPVSTATAYRLATTPNARFFPGRDLARHVDDAWTRECDGPCPYLAGSTDARHLCWAAGTFSRHQPHVVDPGLGQWARDEDVNARGGVVLWRGDSSEDGDDMPADVRRRFPRARSGGTVELPYLMRNPDTPRLRVGIAIVAPRGDLRMAAEPTTTR
jgi:hypothetical protein